MAHQTFVDYYDALNISHSASSAQIRAAYLSLAKKQHPDKGGDLNDMRQLNQAYTTLKIPALKNEYDRRYRKQVLGEKITDISFNADEDWDLDEVDEFLKEVYRQDKHRTWSGPFAKSVIVVGAALLLFIIVAVIRVTTTADTSQTSYTSQKAEH